VFTPAEVGEIRSRVLAYGKSFVVALLNLNEIKKGDINIAIGADGYKESNDLLGFLQAKNCVRKSGHGWLKTKPFKELLQDINANGTGSSNQKTSEGLAGLNLP